MSKNPNDEAICNGVQASSTAASTPTLYPQLEGRLVPDRVQPRSTMEFGCIWLLLEPKLHFSSVFLRSQHSRWWPLNKFTVNPSSGPRLGVDTTIYQ